MQKPVFTRENRPRGRPKPKHRRPSQRLAREEIVTLLRACGDDAAGIRLAALVALGWRSGLRIREALSLRPEDVDLARGNILVKHGKGDRQRVVGLAPDAFPYITRWLAVRASLGVGSEAPLFCRVRRPAGGPLFPSYIREALPALAKRAGLTTRVHYHGLRCSLASELAEAGRPLVAIAGQLGHSNLATTDTYIRRIGAAGLSQMMAEHVQQQTAPKAMPMPGLSEVDIQRIVAAVQASQNASRPESLPHDYLTARPSLEGSERGPRTKT